MCATWMTKVLLSLFVSLYERSVISVYKIVYKV